MVRRYKSSSLELSAGVTGASVSCGRVRGFARSFRDQRGSPNSSRIPHHAVLPGARVGVSAVEEGIGKVGLGNRFKKLQAPDAVTSPCKLVPPFGWGCSGISGAGAFSYAVGVLRRVDAFGTVP